jgi:formylglycine-generating enzyme
MALHHRMPPGLLIPEVVRIPEGWFYMGSEDGQDNERPIHRVWIDSFALGIHQVTNAQYACYLASAGAPAPPTWNDPDFSDPLQPVVSISWFEAVKYCEWLTHTTGGRRYHLPTEAEWERAARGGTEGQLFPWGNTGPEGVPNYGLRWKAGPEPVGRYAPNAFGLYNMCDNVHEWCSDWFHADYYATSPTRNPPGPESGIRRASRGGSWRHHIKITRCAARSSIPPEFQYADYGFRVACDVTRTSN